MDRTHVTDKHDICESCGGSGVAHEVYGPFYADVPKRDRKTYREHVAARHEALKLVDRLLARRFLKLQDAKITDAVEVLGAYVVGIEESWHDGDIPAMRAKVLELAAAAVWILEADGAGTSPSS